MMVVEQTETCQWIMRGKTYFFDGLLFIYYVI